VIATKQPPAFSSEPNALIDNEHTQKQREQWDSVADAWDRHFEWYASCFQPLIDWCCDATALTAGIRVLDIAAGSGLPALAVGERVQSHGSVVAIDISPSMLDLAERRARAAGLRNIEFRAMNAEALAFADHSFDAVTCTFGLMFCSDPARAIAEIQRVLVPGGRFAISTWAEPSRNPFLAIFGRAVAEVLSLPRPPRSAPGPFRFSQRDELEAVIRAGGLTDVEIESRPLPVVYESVEAYQEISKALAPGLQAKLDALTHAETSRLDVLVRAGATPFLDGGRLRLTATPLCAAGRV
jgi:SAM-dependent methyltransferase